MSVGSLFRKIVGSSAGKSVATFALTEAQKAVAALKQTSIGATVASDIAALTDARLTGKEKFEQVVASTAPLVLSLAVSGGAKAAIDDVQDVTRALVQQVYNDTASTKAASVASLILSVLGIR